MDAVPSLQSLLPAGVVIRSPSERSQSGQGMIRAYQPSLTYLSSISLFVGMFLVYSLIALNAAARRRELAVMRATGASRRMLFCLFVGEGAFIGLCGWLLALPVSSVLVKYLLAGVSRIVSMLFVRVQVDQLTLSPWEILLSFTVTLVVAVLAALQPAREAMQVPPRETLDIAPTAAIQPHLIRRMALAGVGMLVLVYPIGRLPSLPSVSLPGYLSALLLFVGFALLAPLVLRQIEADLIAGNGVAVSEVFANSTGLGPGDRYRTQIGNRLLDEVILGVFRYYRTRGGAVYYSLRHYQKRFGDSSWSGVQINFTEGTLTVDGTQHTVQGLAWMDHEFSTAPLQPGITGWDWFSLQLSDRTEIMIFLLRHPDGRLNPASSGTYVLPAGQTRYLGHGDVRVEPLSYYRPVPTAAHAIR